jgi:hypothetical protein
VFPFEIKPLEILCPPGLTPGQGRLRLEVYQRVVISHHSKIYSLKITTPQFQGVDDSPQLLVSGGPIFLSISQFLALKSQGLAKLSKDSTNPTSRGITYYLHLNGVRKIRQS